MTETESRICRVYNRTEMAANGASKLLIPDNCRQFHSALCDKILKSLLEIHPCDAPSHWRTCHPNEITDKASEGFVRGGRPDRSGTRAKSSTAFRHLSYHLLDCRYNIDRDRSMTGGWCCLRNHRDERAMLSGILAISVANICS